LFTALCFRSHLNTFYTKCLHRGNITHTHTHTNNNSVQLHGLNLKNQLHGLNLKNLKTSRSQLLHIPSNTLQHVYQPCLPLPTADTSLTNPHQTFSQQHVRSTRQNHLVSHYHHHTSSAACVLTITSFPINFEDTPLRLILV